MDCSLPSSSLQGFSRQEYWNGLSCPPPGIFLTQGLNLGFLHCRQLLYCWATTQAQQPMAAQAIWETWVVVGCEGGRLVQRPAQSVQGWFLFLTNGTDSREFSTCLLQWKWMRVYNSGYFCLIIMYFFPCTYTHAKNAIPFHYCKMTAAVDLSAFSSVGWKKVNWVPCLLSDKWQLLTGCYLEIVFLNIHK